MSTASVGGKITSATGVEVIVVKVSPDTDISFAPGEPLLLGKRYVCASCGAEVMATKIGPDQAFCHGQAMAMAASKQLPSSD